MMTSRDTLTAAFALGVTIAAAFSLACGGGSSTEPKAATAEEAGGKKQAASASNPMASSDSAPAPQPVQCGEKICDAGQECKNGYCVAGSSSGGGLNAMLGQDSAADTQLQQDVGDYAARDASQLSANERAEIVKFVTILRTQCDSGDEESCQKLQTLSKSLKVACMRRDPGACDLKKALGF